MIGAGCHVFAVWGYAISACDEKGYVELNPQLLSVLLGDSVEHVEKAIDYLCRPDPDSRSKAEKGRRLVREGQFLYRIVNYSKYRAMRNKEERRHYQREWIREKRAKNKGVSTGVDNVDPSRSRSSKFFRRNSDEFRLAKLLFDLIRQRKPDFKEPNLEKWAVDVDRTIRLDKRRPERIEAVIRWCQGDPFWQNNILSTKKLRERYDQLELKMSQDSHRRPVAGNEATAEPANPDDVRRHEQRQRELMGAGYAN